ncbi:MAG: PorV/PorQ family protein [Calditrichaeota bacterium]|nr:PorV/PorQ family protein [Calditrichota bacterium]
MKKICFVSLTLLLTLSLVHPNVFAQKKLAQTGFQYLSVQTDARAAAMAGAFTTVEGSSASLFYNPAGLARLSGFMDVSLNQMNWIADIKYMSGSMALNIAHRKYGVLGISFLTVDYGKFLWTRVASNDQGFVDLPDGWAQPSAYMVGLGYGKELTDRFAVGGQVKYAFQNLGQSYVPVYTENDTILNKKKYSLSTLAFDFGTQYKTGFKSLVFGMSVRNFSKEIKYEKEGFQLPLTFKMGISFNLFEFVPNVIPGSNSLLITVDAAHPRSYPEYIEIGGEYTFMNMLILRAGYTSNQDLYGFTTGFGIRKFGLAIDYSYTPYSVFKNINRFSIRFSL